MNSAPTRYFYDITVSSTGQRVVTANYFGAGEPSVLLSSEYGDESSWSGKSYNNIQYAVSISGNRDGNILEAAAFDNSGDEPDLYSSYDAGESFEIAQSSVAPVAVAFCTKGSQPFNVSTCSPFLRASTSVFLELLVISAR